MAGQGLASPPATATARPPHPLPLLAREGSGSLGACGWRVSHSPAPRGGRAGEAQQANGICQCPRGRREQGAPRGAPENPPCACRAPAGAPPCYRTGQQGEREPINRGKFAGTGGSPVCPGAGAGWRLLPPRAGQAGGRAAAAAGPGRGQAGGKQPSPGQGGRLCEGLAKALPGTRGRLALRGRVAHRVLVGTKSLQRRRTRVLLLFSYLQQPEAEVRGAAGAQRAHQAPQTQTRCVPAGTPRAFTTCGGGPGARVHFSPRARGWSRCSAPPPHPSFTPTPERSQGTAREGSRFEELPGAAAAMVKGPTWVCVHFNAVSVPLPSPESQGGLALPS